MMEILFSAGQAIMSMLAHLDADHAELRAAWQLAAQWEQRAADAVDSAGMADALGDQHTAEAILQRGGIWSLAATELRAALRTDV